MIEQVTAGLDWLTLTLPLGSANDQEWIRAGQTLITDIADEGYDLGYRGLLGYKGISAGNCFVGSREDGHMMQITGRFAEMAFPRIYRNDAHVSRVDAQVTVRFDIMPRNIAGKGYRDAVSAAANGDKRPKRKLIIISGSDGGQTLYVGAFGADQQGRLYNKEVQSSAPEYERTWRYETVLRNERANGFCTRYNAITADKTAFVADIVALWWEARGIEAPWAFDKTATPLPPQKTLPSDVEKQLSWVRTQVAPTIKRLLAAGYRDTLLACLGLLGNDQG